MGRRCAPETAFSPADTRQEARAWADAFQTPFVPRGVHRFATHEEADAWMWAMISRRNTLRDKDVPDLHFLRLLFEQAGEDPPE